MPTTHSSFGRQSATDQANDKYREEVHRLKELFPSWQTEDLSSLLADVGGDVEVAIARIIEGQAEPWGPVHRKEGKKHRNTAQNPKESGPGAKQNVPATASEVQVVPSRLRPPTAPTSSYTFDGPDPDAILRAPLQPDSAEFKDFHVHKTILSIASIFFRNIFSQPRACPTPDGDGESAESPNSARDVDTILELAYVADLKQFDRDAQTRRSQARANLRAQTGWVDEQIEGWRIMLERNPKRDKILRKHGWNKLTPDVVQVVEPAKVLETFLQLVYPVEPPTIDDLSLLDDLLRLAEKYLADGISMKLKKRLVSPSFLANDPIGVFAIACRCNFKDEAKLTIPYTFSLNIVQSVSAEHLRIMSSQAYHRLSKEHALRREQLFNAVLAVVLSSGSRACRCIEGLLKEVRIQIFGKPFLDTEILEICYSSANPQGTACGTSPPCITRSGGNLKDTLLSDIVRGIQTL